MKFLIVLSLVATVLSNDSTENLLRESNDMFTARMFSEVVKSQPDKSVVLSAFSVLSPLALMAMGAEGESHDETLKTIGFPNDNVTRTVFADANKKLRNVEGIELRMANRIYVKSGQELNEQFAVISRDVFGSDVKNVDFAKQVETAQEINTWVEDNTNHRIKDLVAPDSLTPLTTAVLVNAIYFKGTWKSVFNERYTTNRDFYVSKDEVIQVPMMYQSENFNYGESKELDAKLLEMPYLGGQSSLILVLPNEMDGIKALVEKIEDPTLLSKAIDNMSSYEVDVSLPRFKIETTTNLKDVLIKMGCTKIFTAGEARLTNLIKGANDLYISDAIQKAFIEVNEKGSEAAAANQFGIAYLSAVIVEKRTFKADHPFIFILKQRDITLFNGVFQS